MPDYVALQARPPVASARGPWAPSVSRRLRTDPAPASSASLPLTDRQLECLRWISQGKSSADIGIILRISGRTVDYHVAAICERLGVRTRMQAVAQAIRRGWLAN
jgi:DNA-binding CsgD family transcriptional regulator